MRFRWRGRGIDHPDPVRSPTTDAVTEIAIEVQAIAERQKAEAAKLLKLSAELHALQKP